MFFIQLKLTKSQSTSANECKRKTESTICSWSVVIIIIFSHFNSLLFECHRFSHYFFSLAFSFTLIPPSFAPSLRKRFSCWFLFWIGFLYSFDPIEHFYSFEDFCTKLCVTFSFCQSFKFQVLYVLLSHSMLPLILIVHIQFNPTDNNFDWYPLFLFVDIVMLITTNQQHTPFFP